VDELRFDGKSVIVTGGGRGFGRAHALLLASRGARVVVADYGVDLDGRGTSPDVAEAVAKEIVAAGGEAVPCYATVAEESGAEQIVQTALDAFGGLDILVNNAGVSDPDWFEDTDLDRFRRMNGHQYFGTVYMCNKAWPHLKASEHGAIVNTASEAVTGFVPKAASYCGAKGGVFSFTRALALDARRFGMRVNQICPRGNTRMNDPAIMGYHYDVPPETFEDGPTSRMKNEWVSPAVAFLAHESCPLNGETLISGNLGVMRLAIVQTRGFYTEGTITPEDVASNVDSIMNLDNFVLRDLENPPI
jgi:NAD(P)-dependent dehydrogenase (short-subunit alcohol dehydrogenase family)